MHCIIISCHYYPQSRSWTELIHISTYLARVSLVVLIYVENNWWVVFLSVAWDHTECFTRCTDVHVLGSPATAVVTVVPLNLVSGLHVIHVSRSMNQPNGNPFYCWFVTFRSIHLFSCCSTLTCSLQLQAELSTQFKMWYRHIGWEVTEVCAFPKWNLKNP